MTCIWPSQPEASAAEPEWLRKLADALFSTNPPGIDYDSALRTAADEIERLRSEYANLYALTLAPHGSRRRARAAG